MNRIYAMLKDHYAIDGAEVIPQQGGWSALAYKVGTARHDRPQPVQYDCRGARLTKVYISINHARNENKIMTDKTPL
ncbi:hypothetical protein WJ0W_001661 [Paenibacillus melissococcoides]|uniref:Uncharacterized protein n=1 Tax=Paenibacillus melissococcoides TaxID=2912268 RepID=A0ABN8U031_9BACL|nr:MULTISPECIES: hypothetical protein [Paenibacillus]MEB9896912.1 hypothetical protein [Bacillus cereus]CAH8244426.1 hypothetical protein WJ0W_001661 [Paenibacillus melissococcoides]CAH8703234.1 hypothetical protein HTL2_000011 [Paenibacillus melissococcoides]CAH8705558.1 hypothetical protein WDD9_000971 [Paenibacillus melissococcoides]GIO82472.1 hypothetical protein J6TS7_60820 [Paenibacillus dendritiformis]